MSDELTESMLKLTDVIKNGERIKCRLEVLRLLSEPRVTDLREVLMRWVDGKPMEGEFD